MTSNPAELSRREREVMDIVYRLGEVTASEVREAMADPPTNAAVRATLRSLVDKDHLEYEHDGPRYRYRPTVSRDVARRSALRHLVRTFFGGSSEGAMATLLEMEANDLSDEQRQRLKELIDRAAEEGR